MSEFTERIQRNQQVMIAGLISTETKDALNKIAKATKRSKSGIIELALKQWIRDEEIRNKGSVEEIVETEPLNAHI